MVRISDKNANDKINHINVHSGAERFVQTIRPDFKPGIRIRNADYLGLALYILDLISDDEELTLVQVINNITHRFKFSDLEVIAYNVKLDLEARGYISFRPSLLIKHQRWLCITSKGKKFLSQDSELDSKGGRG